MKTTQIDSTKKARIISATGKPSFFKKRLWLSLAILVGLLAPVTSVTVAGHGMGNGGDHIRATFIRMGNSVVSYLRETTEGAAIVSDHGLSLAALDQTLTIDVISVFEGLLTDNGGSAVDAIGVPGKISLSSTRWMNHFEANRDVYFLVFHEMLRAAAVNDDNYVISKKLSPFPQGRRIITRTTTLYPLLGSALLSDVFDPAAIRLIGTGCPTGIAGTFLDFDTERNILDITFNRYDIHVGAEDPTAGRKACSVVIPYNVPAGSRLKVVQMDFSANVELATGAQAAISADIAFGAQQATPKTSSVTATAPLQGRLLVRQSGVYESSCSAQSGLISLHSAATASSSSGAGSIAAPDRISLSFDVEPCTALRR
jgi:Domain of unknown function (DUF4360)